MPSKESTRNNDKSAPGQKPLSNGHNSFASNQPIHPSHIIQRALLNSASLSPVEIMQLQSTIGNQAVGRLLSGIMQCKSADIQCTPAPVNPLINNDTIVQRSPVDNQTGQQIPGTIRSQMETAFDADFSPVRIHPNSPAVPHGASAAAIGENIHFSPGHYQPGRMPGLCLLGHELAHVLQQRRGGTVAMQHSNVPVNTDSYLEREAADAGAAAARRQKVQVRGKTQATGQQLGWTDIQNFMKKSQFDQAADMLENDVKKNVFDINDFENSWNAISLHLKANRAGQIFRDAMSKGIVSPDFLRSEYIGLFPNPQQAPVELTGWALKNVQAVQADPTWFAEAGLPLKDLKSILLQGKTDQYQNPNPEKILTYHLFDKTGEHENFPGGYQATYTINAFKTALAKVTNIAQSAQLAVQTLIQALDKAFEWAVLIEEYAKDDLDSKNLEKMHTLARILVQEISDLPVPKQNVQEPAPMILIPSGNKGHATLMRVSRQAKDLYRIIHYNTGSGLEKHQSKTIDGIEKHQTFYEKSAVKDQATTDPKLWQLLIANKVNPNINTVYTKLDQLPVDNSKQSNQQPSDEYFEQKQRLGSCTWQSIMALFRQYILEAYQNNPEEGLLQYKIIKAQLSNVVFDQFKGGIGSEMRTAGRKKLVKRNRYLADDDPQDTLKAAKVVLAQSLPPQNKQQQIKDFDKKAKIAIANGSNPKKLDALYRLLIKDLQMGKADTSKVSSNNPVVAAALEKYQETQTGADPIKVWEGFVELQKQLAPNMDISKIEDDFNKLMNTKREKSDFAYRQAMDLLGQVKATELNCDQLLKKITDPIIKSAITAYKRKIALHMADPLAELSQLLDIKPTIRKDISGAKKILQDGSQDIQKNPPATLQERAKLLKKAMTDAMGTLKLSKGDTDALNKFFTKAKHPLLKARLFDIIIDLQ